MVNVYIVSVEWKNKLAGVRKLNFNVGIKISRAFYTEKENKYLKHFQANENAIAAGICCVSYPIP